LGLVFSADGTCACVIVAVAIVAQQEWLGGNGSYDEKPYIPIYTTIAAKSNRLTPLSI
jgi:hypothetical protein